MTSGMSTSTASTQIETRSSGSPDELWLAYRVVCPGPELRLFCLAHAGSGASLFRHWCRPFAPRVEVCPVQLPGRENRLGEQALASLPELIDRLTDALAGQLDRRFAIFGHSMGALI